MKIYIRNIANSPYVVFVISWSLCLLLYSLGSAGILPPLSLDLFVFIICFIILFGVTAFFLYKNNFTLNYSKPFNINYRALLVINSIIFLPNFVYSGIPLLGGVRDENFGIPSVMDIATSLNAFTCICCYYMYLTTGKKKQLVYCLYCSLLFVLIISRGYIVMSMVTMFFLWLNVKKPALNLFKITAIIVGIIAVSYIFGVAGNLRMKSALAQIDNPDNPDLSNSEYNSDVILDLGEAKGAFKNKIPGEFFWSYIYLTSPLSNLQYNINISSPPFTEENFLLTVVNETSFDFIAKRVNALHKGYERKTPELIIPNFTVSTTLAGSYATAGWWGMFYVLIMYWLFPVFYILLMAKNPLAIIGVSTLCTIYFFSIFDNMFVLSGLSLQLFYPILVKWFQNIRFSPDPKSTIV